MRRRDHPSFPSEITCCFFSVLKTLLMPSEPIRALSGVNVPGFSMAGFQLTLYGRIWATPEDDACDVLHVNAAGQPLPSRLARGTAPAEIRLVPQFAGIANGPRGLSPH